jgi:hypothetical protein
VVCSRPFGRDRDIEKPGGFVNEFGYRHAAFLSFPIRASAPQIDWIACASKGDTPDLGSCQLQASGEEAVGGDAMIGISTRARTIVLRSRRRNQALTPPKPLLASVQAARCRPE